MSTAISTNPVGHPPKAKQLPSREAINRRLVGEREKISKAQSIVTVVAQALDRDENGENFAMWNSLNLAVDLLDDAFGSLDTMEVLKAGD